MKKIISLVLILTVALSVATISVFAASAEESVNNFGCSIDIYSDDNNFDTNNFVWDEKSMNDLFISYDPNTFGKMKWDLPNSVDNVALLNVEYDSLSNEMKSLGYGQNHSLAAPKTEIGYSNNVISLFSSTFGNTDNSLPEMKMPDGWTVSNIMDVAQKNRTDVLGDFKSSESYQSIANTINTSSVFEAASKTMTMPECSSVQDCASQLSGISSPFSLNKEEYYKKGSKYDVDIDAQKMFTNYCKDIENWSSNQSKTTNEILGELDQYFDGNIEGLINGLFNTMYPDGNPDPDKNYNSDNFSNNSNVIVGEGLEEYFGGQGINYKDDDMDNDNIISIKDITFKQKQEAGLLNATSDNREEDENILPGGIFDVNGDGVINEEDEMY